MPINADFATGTSTIGNFEETEDGGLIVRNIVAMSPGTWTSMSGITCRFTEEVLRRCCGQWSENSGLYSRHPPRSTTCKVGAVIPGSARYVDGEGVVVDVYLHRRTGQSRDLSEAIRIPKEQGGLTDVSVETVIDQTPQGDVVDITFTGLAVVETGACDTCKVPAFSAGQEGEEMTEEEKETSASGGGEDKQETLVSVASALFRDLGYDDIASLLDVASVTDDKAALDEIMVQLKEKGKNAAPDIAIAELSAKVDERLTAFAAEIKNVAAEVDKIGRSAQAQFAKHVPARNDETEKEYVINRASLSRTLFGGI